MIPQFQPPRSSSLVIPFMAVLEIELELVRVDVPLCVLLRDSLGRRYLAHFCGCEKHGAEYWYIVPISDALIPRLLSGQVSLNTALSDIPSHHRLIGQISKRNEHTFEFRDFQACESLDALAKCLPNSSFRFFEDEFLHYLSAEFAPIASYARQCMAEVFYLRLLGQRMLPNLLPLTNLADVGKALQRLLTNLAMFGSDSQNFGRRGYVSHSVEHASQFALTAVAAGSVQLRIESIRSPELIEEFDVVHKGASFLAKLTEPSDVAQLCRILSEYPPRIKSSYLSYLTSLSKTEAGVKLQWGSPRRQTAWESEWSAELVTEIVDQVSQLAVSKETVFEATGLFTAGSLHTGRFEFLDTATNRSVTGHLAPDVQQEIVTLSRGVQKAVLYNVSIREVVSTTPDNTIKYEYTFLDVQETRKRRQ